jgi:uncharacterized membrane protein YfcA
MVLLGALAAFVIAMITAPAGVSGAVFLLPVQVSLLDVPSPAVTPTNLLYNVIATPGALLRFWRTGQLRTPLARVLLIGTMPGVVVGAILRVTVLDQPQTFLVVVACVLLPLGTWLVLRRGPSADHQADPPLPSWLVPVALAVGVIGGVYGIGGGSILAPILLAVGFSIATVSGAALLATFATSVVGIATYEVLALVLSAPDPIGPRWTLGLALGVGGLLGSYVGARLQPYVPAVVLRRLLGVLAILVGARYLWQALS